MATEYHQQTLSNLRVEHDYYTTRQVSEIYHVSLATACTWCRKGWLQADRERKLNSRGRGGRWKIHPKQLEDVESRKDELIEQSRRYWMRLYVKMKK
jgi:hypothetical protein